MNNNKGWTQGPKAKRIDHKLTIHGHERIDPYYWMNQRDSADVLEYIEQENKHVEAYFEPLKPLQDKLLEEFEMRINPNEESAPFKRNGIQYQIRNKAHFDYALIYSIQEDGTETLFLDENERAEGSDFYQLADWSPSPNNKLLALGEDRVGRRLYTIRFRDNESGDFLEDSIEDTDGSLVWANDNQTVFYVKKDPVTLREYQVWRHVMGQPASTDELVYHEKDEKYYVYVDKSMTGRYIEIGSFSSLTSEVSFIDANAPMSEAVVFMARELGHLYSVDDHESGFYITSNHEAPNRQLLKSASFPTTLENCERVQSHQSDVLIENLLVLKEYMVIEERVNGLTRFQVVHHDTEQRKVIQFKEEAYSLRFAFNDDYQATSFNFSYNSLSTPNSVYTYELSNDTRTLIHQKEVTDPNFDADNYTTLRVWAPANDGTQIPVSLVVKKGVDLSKAPMLLYAYGSYGYTIPETFSPTRLSLLERGFIFALAHVRGGKYLGEAWYEDGKFEKKKNTFTDFINVAEYLGHHGYCDPNAIYAQGGSAGGLLMGAVTNMAPYLWKGVLAQVPFMDVVTTMLDESIPLTVGEYEEWGNPNEKKYYDYMLSYSPYDNLRKMHYPAIFITTGYHDSQVQYWEPLKYVAKIRSLKLDNKPLLFDCNMDAGHGGGSGRTAARKEVAKMYAFILNLQGISE